MPKLMIWCDTLAAVRSVMLDLKRRDQRNVYAHIYGAPPLAHGTHTAFGDARTNVAIAREPRIRLFIENKANHKKYSYNREPALKSP